MFHISKRGSLITRRNAMMGTMGVAAGFYTPTARAAITNRAAVNKQYVTTGPNAVTTSDANSLNSRKLGRAPLRSAISDIVVSFPGFTLDVTPGELPIPAAYQVKASIEYPLGTTPRRMYFGGIDTGSVAPGLYQIQSDPFPVAIPAGAQFAIKCWVKWVSGDFCLYGESFLNPTEWTTWGTDVADNTLNLTTLTPTGSVGSFGAMVYATLKDPCAAAAIIGDSNSTPGQDWLDLTVGEKMWGRAMRGQLPFTTVGRGGGLMASYVAGSEGRSALLRDAVTHVIIEYGRNDIYSSNASFATVKSNLQTMLAYYLSRGIKCFVCTLPPDTNSTDGWKTIANQTQLDATNNIVRMAYNSWLRTNWAAEGITALIDVCAALDPSDIAAWAADDPTPTPVTPNSVGFAVLSGGVVTSIAVGLYAKGANSRGLGYTPSTDYPTIIFPYPGMAGSGAAATMHADAGGYGSTYTVDNGGSGYDYPPMVHPLSTWTPDGTHYKSRGSSEVIRVTGLCPEMFVLT